MVSTRPATPRLAERARGGWRRRAGVVEGVRRTRAGGSRSPQLGRPGPPLNGMRKLLLDGHGRLYSRSDTPRPQLMCHGIVPAALCGDRTRTEAPCEGWWPTLAPALEVACTAGVDQRWDADSLTDAIASTVGSLGLSAVPSKRVIRQLAEDVLEKKIRSY